MIISELFNSPPNYRVKTEKSHRFDATAVINGRKLEFYAYKESNDSWTIGFGEYDEKLKDYTYRKTNSGGEIKVFSTLYQFVLELISRYHPRLIHFTGERDRRGAYVKLFSGRREIPGFRFYYLEMKHEDFYFLERINKKVAEEQKLFESDFDFNSLKGKVITFEDEKIGVKQDFTITKVVQNESFHRGQMDMSDLYDGPEEVPSHGVASRNISVYLKELKIKKKDDYTPFDHEISSYLRHYLIRGEKLPPSLSKKYFKFAHPYADFENKTLLDSLKAVIPNCIDVHWSEMGMQGNNFINVDVRYRY
jgi:hypothetical protein